MPDTQNDPAGTAFDPGEEQQGTAAMVIPVWLARTMYVVAALFALAALVVDVVGVSDWKVDEVTLGLIAVLLIIPLLEQIQTLRLGGMEAEFRAKIRTLENKVSDVRDFATRPEADAPAARGFANGASDAQPEDAMHIKRIVWVDDQPENNRLEAQELGRRFDVIQVTSTEGGLAEVGKSPADTAVITDSAREEGRRLNKEAGLELIRKLAEDQPGVPVYVYCGPATAAAYGGDLRGAGARLVTASFSELNARLRKDARTSFVAEVQAVLQRTGAQVARDQHGLDFVVRVGDERIGVIAKDWWRPPKVDAVRSAGERFGQGIENHEIDRGMIVTSREVFRPDHRAALPDRVELVKIDALAESLSARAPA